MGRLGGVGMGIVLAAALSAPALATFPSQPQSLSRVADFSQAFALRFFGETSDATATQNAAFGDRPSESPLRDFVLRVSFIKPVDYSALRMLPYTALANDTLPRPALLASQVFHAPRFIAAQTFSESSFGFPSQPVTGPLNPGSASQPGEYRPYRDSAGGNARSSISFTYTPVAASTPGVTTFTPQLTPVSAYDSVTAEPGAQSAFVQNGAGLSLPVNVDVGKLHFRGHVDGAQAQATSLSLETQSMGAGADATIHALRHDVHVNVGGSYEHLTRNDALPLTSTAFDTTSTLQLAPNGLVPIPAYADLSKRTVSAGVAVPVTRNVTVGAQYDQQRLLGGVGAQGVSNVDARNDIYGGNVTFRLPNNPAASISLSAKQYRFQDNLVPSNAFTQTRADLNFTVKFH